MKIFSYLHSGTPVLATDLPTHTQVVDSSLGYLAGPDPESFSAAMLEIIGDYSAARDKASKARQFIGDNHSMKGFNQRVLDIYNHTQDEIFQR